jgi:hypothetical protein
VGPPNPPQAPDPVIYSGLSREKATNLLVRRKPTEVVVLPLKYTDFWIVFFWMPAKDPRNKVRNAGKLLLDILCSEVLAGKNPR